MEARPVTLLLDYSKDLALSGIPGLKNMKRVPETSRSAA